VLQFAVAFASVPEYQIATMLVAFVAVPLAAVALTRHCNRQEEVVPVPVETLVHPVMSVGAVVLPLRYEKAICSDLAVGVPLNVQDVVPVQEPFAAANALPQSITTNAMTRNRLIRFP
jgi:hypothetical protein